MEHESSVGRRLHPGAHLSAPCFAVVRFPHLWAMLMHLVQQGPCSREAAWCRAFCRSDPAGWHTHCVASCRRTSQAQHLCSTLSRSQGTRTVPAGEQQRGSHCWVPAQSPAGPSATLHIVMAAFLPQSRFIATEATWPAKPETHHPALSRKSLLPSGLDHQSGRS